jgi:hypothetical protein
MGVRLSVPFVHTAPVVTSVIRYPSSCCHKPQKRSGGQDSVTPKFEQKKATNVTF